MISDQLLYRIRQSAAVAAAAESGPRARYGEDIFNGGDYPRTWTQFIGQAQAVAHLQAAIRSAQSRGVRLDHVLLASGAPGIGKTSLAKLIAASMDVGIVEISGQVDVEEARAALLGMADGDVLFYDEIHQAVSGGKVKAEWLLSLLQDGGLTDASGFHKMPDVTVIAATTDAQRLPATILGRFMVRPVLETYSPTEGLQIATNLAQRLHLEPEPTQEDLAVIAAASNQSPRAMKALLIALRDTRWAGSDGYDVDLALTWSGVSRDGLDRLAQDMLITLAIMCNGKASLATLAGLLGEPGPLTMTEQLLQSKGYMVIEPQGRRLTTHGAQRVESLVHERGLT